MKPLIEITTVPIQIEMKTTNARLEYARGTAEMEISRDNGNLQIKSRPIKVNIDTFEARNSLSPTLARYLDQSAKKGHQAAYEATATYARQGQLLLQTQVEFTVTQRPDVVIKYVGGPIYVPPSSDPNYEPVDVKV